MTSESKGGIWEWGINSLGKWEGRVDQKQFPKEVTFESDLEGFIDFTQRRGKGHYRLGDSLKNGRERGAQHIREKRFLPLTGEGRERRWQKKKKKPGKLLGPDHEGILKIILSYVHFI